MDRSTPHQTAPALILKNPENTSRDDTQSFISEPEAYRQANLNITTLFPDECLATFLIYSPRQMLKPYRRRTP